VKCEECGEVELNPRRVKLGYTICLKCSEAETERYVGRRTDKHGDTEIFRSNLLFIRAQLRRENAVGFNASAGIQGIVTQEKEKGGDKDE